MYRFLLHQDPQYGFVIFGTIRNLECLRDSSDLYIDSTFDSTPTLWGHFLNIMGNYGGRALCFLNVLMAGKTQQEYIAVFNAVQVSPSPNFISMLLVWMAICNCDISQMISQRRRIY